MRQEIGEIIQGVAAVPPSNDLFGPIRSDDRYWATSLDVQYHYCNDTLDQATFDQLSDTFLQQAEDSNPHESLQPKSAIEAIGRISGLNTVKMSQDPALQGSPHYLDMYINTALAEVGRIAEAVDRFVTSPRDDERVVECVLLSPKADLVQKHRVSAKVNELYIPRNPDEDDELTLEGWGEVFASAGLVNDSQKLAKLLAGETKLLSDFDRHDEYAWFQRQRARHLALAGEWAHRSQAAKEAGLAVDNPELIDTTLHERIGYFDFDDVETTLLIASKMAVNALKLGLAVEPEYFIDEATKSIGRGVESRVGVLGLANIAVFSALIGEPEYAERDYRFAVSFARDVVPKERVRLHETGYADPSEGDAYVHKEISKHGKGAYVLKDIARFGSHDKLRIARNLAVEGEHDLAIDFAVDNLPPREQLFPVVSILQHVTLQKVRDNAEEVLANTLD